MGHRQAPGRGLRHGEGARAEVQRTIFVVGDKKQSIYSFQGADPEGFDRMRVHFGERLRGVGLTLQETDLLYSFRSARPILELVDEVCGPERATGVGGALEHKAFHAERPGRVDLWPLVPTQARVRTWRGAIRRTSWASITISPCWRRRWPTASTRC
jgi:ATP-dependent exoDNAse (exonuclease V) beta subunit